MSMAGEKRERQPQPDSIYALHVYDPADLYDPNDPDFPEINLDVYRDDDRTPAELAELARRAHFARVAFDKS